MSLITMSQNELNRLEAMQKIRTNRLSVIQAADLLHISRSQVHRLLQAYDRAGADGLYPGNVAGRAIGATPTISQSRARPGARALCGFRANICLREAG